jgi:signal transduction histidine kinase
MPFSYHQFVLLTALFLFSSATCKGQDVYFDSLRRQGIEGEWNDDRIEKFDKWISFAIPINHDSTSADLQRLKRLSDSHQSSFGHAVYLMNYAYWYTEKTGDYEKGLSYAEEARSIFENERRDRQLVVCLCRIAFFKLWNEIAQNQQALDESILNDYLLPAQQIAETANDNQLRVIVAQWIGSYYNVSRKDNSKALTYFLDAEKMNDSNLDPIVHLTTLASIGIIYSEMCDDKNVLLYLRKSENADFSDQYPYALGNLYRSVSNYFLSCKRELPQALLYAEKSLEKANQLSAPEYVSLSLKRLYQIFKAMGNTDQALEYLERYNQEEAKIAREKFEFAYSQYNIQNKEKLILQQKLALQQKNIVFLISIGFFVLFVIAIIIVFYIRKRRLTELSEQTAEANRQSLELAVRQTEEEERRRISENLHDSVVQTLVVARMNIESLQKGLAFSSKDQLIIRNIQTLIEDSTTEIRRISHTIMPASFESDGLSKVVHELSVRMINTDVKVEVFEDGDFKNLPKNLAIVAFRIIQECVQNALKHAHAKTIFISLSIENNQLDVSIEDDGIGFDKTSNLDSRQGLRSIGNRMIQLKGQFEIETEVGRGTCIHFHLPVNL